MAQGHVYKARGNLTQDTTGPLVKCTKYNRRYANKFYQKICHLKNNIFFQMIHVCSFSHCHFSFLLLTLSFHLTVSLSPVHSWFSYAFYLSLLNFLFLFAPASLSNTHPLSFFSSFLLDNSDLFPLCVFIFLHYFIFYLKKSVSHSSNFRILSPLVFVTFLLISFSWSILQLRHSRCQSHSLFLSPLILCLSSIIHQ